MAILQSIQGLFQRLAAEPLIPIPLPEGEDEIGPSSAPAPAALPVHVLEGSALARVAEGRLVIERPDEEPIERPLEFVSSLHIHGWAGITSPCLAALLRQGSPVIWRGATGYPIGYAADLNAAGLEARRAQFAAAQSGRNVELARALVAAKIVNMRGLLRRRGADKAGSALKPLAWLARKARHGRTVERLLGLEGSASAHYFGAWPAVLADHAGAAFPGRSRRPPNDGVNAALSYAYAVLAGECLTAVVAAGLDPRLGFLHAARSGRPALALDVMEPFRPLVCDSVVLGCFNRDQLHDQHFAPGDDRAMRLTDAGRRILLGAIEQRLSSEVTFPDRAAPCSYREAIGLQARALNRSLARGEALAVLERP